MPIGLIEVTDIPILRQIIKEINTTSNTQTKNKEKYPDGEMH